MDDQREMSSASAMISTSTVRLLHEVTGRGPTKAKTVIHDDMVTVLLATRSPRASADSWTTA